MPLSRPTLKELVTRIATDLQSRKQGADALLRRSNLNVLSKVEAGAAHGLYGYVDNVARQIIPDTADSEHLERWAEVWGVARNPAVAAIGLVTFTGLNTTAIPAGTVLQRSDGVQFTTDVTAAIALGTATVAVTAVEPGLDGETEATSALVLSTPIVNINSNATVAAGGLTGGSEVESDDDLRDRLLHRIRRPPQGGADSDYENWCLEVPGVTRVWVKPLYLGAGTVGIFFVRDNDVSAIPDAGEVALVQAYIDARRPVTAEVTVMAPVASVVNFTIALLPDTLAVREAVATELADLLRREAEPGGTIYLSHVREAVSLAAGEENSLITVPAADLVAGAGQMHVMGVVTWV